MKPMNYKSKKEDCLRSQNPYKVIDKNTIRFLGNHVYELDGKEYQVTPRVASQIDRFIGLDTQQARSVYKAMGQEGVRDYRNYLAMVNSITNPQKMAVIAEPETRTIVGVSALKKDVIPMESFFDFAEMFANDNHYSIEGISRGQDVTAGISLRLIPDTQNIVSLGKDEDFMTNGYVLNWNLGSIEIGYYYERLSCLNGAVEKVYGKQAGIYSMGDREIRKMLEFPQVAASGFGRFSTNAVKAMETRASLAELQYAAKLLLKSGLEEELSETIIPFQSDLQAYHEKGYVHIKGSVVKSSLSVWEVFNRITYFASHNDLWEPDDNRRGHLMAESVRFLHRKRDIQEYYNIF